MSGSQLKVREAKHRYCGNPSAMQVAHSGSAFIAATLFCGSQPKRGRAWMVRQSSAAELRVWCKLALSQLVHRQALAAQL